ncbi:hypothetical protein [Streptomyces boluensis]|uniref:Uncharacterized protein n=1 Tax=Streptomyces boluensis TaxID=1775135 RepID=A0A964V1R2_9ACTN|nr:hypothetical protein [Streptomyces boluensis]NBE57002.1 hypothetical protein [Streptomyces boluensis]
MTTARADGARADRESAAGFLQHLVENAQLGAQATRIPVRVRAVQEVTVHLASNRAGR